MGCQADSARETKCFMTLAQPNSRILSFLSKRFRVIFTESYVKVQKRFHQGSGRNNLFL